MIENVNTNVFVFLTHYALFASQIHNQCWTFRKWLGK
jgi:hypothetical protein